jgi:hypothetical protein
MAFNGSGGTGYADLSAFRSEGKEPGARRKKLAGYLKAANDLRSSYWAGGDTNTSKVGDEAHDNPFPDAAIVKHGNAEMILFPSYARKHVKTKVRSIMYTCILSADLLTVPRNALSRTTQVTTRISGDGNGTNTKPIKPLWMSTCEDGYTTHNADLMAENIA